MIGLAACVPIGDGMVEDDPKKWPPTTRHQKFAESCDK
jgi:hypothetical protein